MQLNQKKTSNKNATLIHQVTLYVLMPSGNRKYEVSGLFFEILNFLSIINIICYF
jgi:hypothetical protein